MPDSAAAALGAAADAVAAAASDVSTTAREALSGTAALASTQARVLKHEEAMLRARHALESAVAQKTAETRITLNKARPDPSSPPRPTLPPPASPLGIPRKPQGPYKSFFGIPRDA